MQLSEHKALPMGTLISVQVGKPQVHSTVQGRTWESAIVKTPVAAPVMVRKENLVGDAQANRKYHGGPDKAVCGYSFEHFACWQERFHVEMSGGRSAKILPLPG